MVAGLLVAFLGQPCRDGPFYLQVVAVTLFPIVVVWSNHIVVAPVRAPRGVLVVAAGSLRTPSYCSLL
jgi:hypothetical protein